jgi:hypothetical protein
MLRNRTEVKLRLVVVVAILGSLIACESRDPGPLKGTWRATGPVPMTVTYRSGESEVHGVIEKASYDVAGDDVIVTTESGPLKGLATRLQIVDPNTLQAAFGRLHRVRAQ